jgi:hypothetical protein
MNCYDRLNSNQKERVDRILSQLKAAFETIFMLMPEEHPLGVYFMAERELGLAVKDECRRRRNEF